MIYRSTIAAFALGITLAGCGTPGTASSVAAPALRSSRNLIAGSKLYAKQDLLYVSATDSDKNLQVYTYPQGDVVGGAVIYGTPFGLCSDVKGNVYVSTLQSTSVYEFAHGATTPFRTLVQPNYFTSGCAVDPMSGDLAVVDFSLSGSPGRHGGVSIFSQASGAPKVYKNSDIDYYYECAYDGDGDLFVVGTHGRNAGGKNNELIVAELPRTGSSLNTVKIAQQLRSPGGIQWDGQYIVLSGDSRPPLYRYQANSQGLTLQDSVNLAGAATLAPFWIQKNKIVSAQYYEKYYLAIWPYPKGGDPKKAFTVVEAMGLTVSVGSAK